MKRAFVFAFGVVLNVASSACADEVVRGRVGGSLYQLVRPANWNGRLVLYAHGFVPSDAPVALPPEGSLLISLLAPQGFAVAYPSFSENGWAVKDGTERTHQLLGIFSARFGRPARVYITGVSMGGLIAIKLSETYPGIYAGALPAGAVAGGSRRQCAGRDRRYADDRLAGAGGHGHKSRWRACDGPHRSDSNSVRDTCGARRVDSHSLSLLRDRIHRP